MREQQGLASPTIERYTIAARQFLKNRFGDGAVDMRSVVASDIIDFIRDQSARLRPPGLKCVVTAMRSFLRFGQYRGDVAAELVAAVPAVATWATTPALPLAISPDHAQRAIDSCDLSTPIGLRDRAILLILARLGLRANEVITLQLSDCDWDRGHLRVRSKGGRECLLPLPDDVGSAIAAYLEHGRPAGQRSPPVPALDGTDLRLQVGLGRHRIDREVRVGASRRRRAAPRLAPVPACAGRASASRRRLVRRDRRGAAAPQPADHLDLCPCRYRRTALLWRCPGREVRNEHAAQFAPGLPGIAPRSGLQDERRRPHAPGLRGLPRGAT